jgi:hypothetical protein
MASRTLLSLRTELAQRLGFSASGSGAILQKDLLNSALRSGQEQLYYEYGDILTHRVNNTDPGATVSGVTLYEFPLDCDPQKPLTVSLQRQGGIFEEMQIGIGVNQHNVDPTIGNQFPARWDVLNSGTFAGVVKPKIELWPTPDAIYNMKLEYNAALGEFTEDTDTTTIPAQLILLHAIVTMKSHYQQTDFQLYVGQLEQLLGRLKTIGLQAGGSTRRYFKRSQAFSLDPESTWPMASNVTQQVINIASTIISTTDATLIEAADSP